MPEIAQTTEQWFLIRQWLSSLRQLPDLDLIWLEGSLARGLGNPSSDIDIRFAIADGAYGQLWNEKRSALLVGLGDTLTLETRFMRVLTSAGIIVEASAYRTSELDQLELYEWEILFSRLPTGHPTFRHLPERTPAELWPSEEELTVELVRTLNNHYLLLLANSPAPLFNGELHSARFQLDDLRTGLVQGFYRRLGLRFAKRFKHFSEIFPAEWLADLDTTYMAAGSAPLDVAAMAEAYIALFAMVGKHLQALSDKAGGGFEATWYFHLHALISAQFRRLITH